MPPHFFVSRSHQEYPIQSLHCYQIVYYPIWTIARLILIGIHTFFLIFLTDLGAYSSLNDFEGFLRYTIENSGYDRYAVEHFKHSPADYIFDGEIEAFEQEFGLDR